MPPAGGKTSAFSEGFIARVARGLGYIATGRPQDWFGPLDPMTPIAPPEIAGRQFDYPVGFNLALGPRAYEPVGFPELRALADAYDLIRAIIETRKDQLERLRWQIRRRDSAVAHDPRIAEIEAFFARPDRVHWWSTWLRMLVEDLLVIDAPALYLRRTRDGKLYALEPLDGATVKRVIDDFGRTPAPPAPAYQQILKGMPAVDYTTEDLLYFPRNVRVHKVYGFSPVEQIQMTVNIALRRQLYQLQYYTEGNIPEALIGVPENWNPDQIRQFQAYWDSLHEGNTAERRHAKFVPGGVAKTFIPTREPVLKDVFDEWLARICCFAFSISPQPFVQQLNRATAESAHDAALAEGLLPLQNWVKQLVDYVILTEFGAPDLEFTWADDRESDPEKAAAIAVQYVKAGVKSVNEVRGELGLDPVPGGDAPALSPTGGGAEGEKLLRSNFRHYGPGPRGGQFAPKPGGSIVLAADETSRTSAPPSHGGSSAPSKPWVNQPHSAFRQQIAEEEGSKGKRNDGYQEFHPNEDPMQRALGRYQIEPRLLQDAGWMDKEGKWNAAKGVTSDEQFLNDPAAQEQAMTDVLNVLQRQVKADHLDSYIGQTYQGLLASITVTEAGLVAAAHRQGAPTLVKYFNHLRAWRWHSDPAEMTPAEKHIEKRLRIFQHVPY